MPADVDGLVLKVCGLTRVADLRCAEAAGADYCGCIVEIERSPRSLARDEAVLLARACRVQPVLVVEHMPLDDLLGLAEAAHPAAVQLHGDAGAEYMLALVDALRGRAGVWRSLGLPAQAENRDTAVAAALAEIAACREADVSAIVLDTHTERGTGGTGQTCDWEAAAAIITDSPLPVLLAGGLSPENLREAIEATSPAGVDLSSSLESSPGRKDPARLRQLAASWRAVE